ncbi:MAG: glutamate-1-semialdehyde 2,1-aminomutase [Deltaproteobacteria bacterium]|nr:glutamate-1-semialdehyde 2,1-aminomutase [Deltaproteobacteria bacterium]
MNTSRSQALFEQAGRLIPGGVNSPVRAAKSVGGLPRFLARGKGSKVIDADGNEFIDYVCSWGPLILGHAPLAVNEAILEALRDGTSFGAPTEREIVMAELIAKAVPSMEMVRMVNSGTEAVMSAVRLARGFTGRDFIIKFDGCYHGHSDGLLVAAGSGLATLGIPDSPGVPAAIAGLTLSLPYNDLDAVTEAMNRVGEKVAAILVEPIAGNMGVVLPEPGWLAHLRSLCDKFGSILVFDEVISGFRAGISGAQGLFGIRPDLTCLGKIIGGGLPVGAYGGRRDVMEKIAPEGPVYQAGTLSGNPVAMAAGIAAIKELMKDGGAVYAKIEETGALLEEGLKRAVEMSGINACINRAGSVLTLFFTEGPVKNYIDAKKSDTALFGRFFREMALEGIYLPPSQFEAWFVSAAHTKEDVEKTVMAVEKSLLRIRG